MPTSDRAIAAHIALAIVALHLVPGLGHPTVTTTTSSAREVQGSNIATEPG